MGRISAWCLPHTNKRVITDALALARAMPRYNSVQRGKTTLRLHVFECLDVGYLGIQWEDVARLLVIMAGSGFVVGKVRLMCDVVCACVR